MLINNYWKNMEITFHRNPSLKFEHILDLKKKFKLSNSKFIKEIK